METNNLDLRIEKILIEIQKKFPAIIARSSVEAATGGLVTSKYLANLDSLGTGPKERIRSGRKIGYPTGVFCDWLRRRMKIEQ